jgi:hypothetical protein
MAREKTYRLKEDDNKKTIVLIGVLLILIFVVGGGLLYVITQKGGAPMVPPSNQTNNTPPQNQTNQTGQNNTQNQTQVCDDACLFDAAVGAQNASACSAINSSSLEQGCYSRLSNVSLDACRAVVNDTLKESCVTYFAVSEGNMSLCDLLSQGKDACRRAVDPCFDAADATLCRAIEDNDPSECAGDSNCLLNYSMAAGDESGCSLITNTVVSTACRSAVKYTDKCSSLPEDSERDYCYDLFAVYSGDEATCTQISRNSMYALECYSYFAIKLRNLTYCGNERLELNDMWGCYRNYSLGTGDIAGCKAIDPLASTNQFLCVFEFAKKYGDPSACEIIETLASRKTCYEGSILYSNSNLKWQNCRDVTNFVWENKCYTESAKLYKDVSICNNIDEDFAKETCMNAYASNQTK